jgi:hypothetical protein
LELIDVLSPLLGYRSGTAIPKPQEVPQINYLLNYLAPYIFAVLGDKGVSIRKRDLWVNATHILKFDGRKKITRVL